MIVGVPISWDMRYKSNCEVGKNSVHIGWIQKTGTPAEKDILYALRGFQLESKVTVSVTKKSDGSYFVKFLKWKAEATDRYDFNAVEGISLPNPDFGKKPTEAFTPIAPELQSFRVSHQNTARVEAANLARPFNLFIGPWDVTDEQLLKDAVIQIT